MPSCSQEAPSCTQEAPSWLQVGSKRPPRGSKLAPRGAQEAPSWLQEAPKRLQVGPRRHPSKANELQNSSPRALVPHKSYNFKFSSQCSVLVEGCSSISTACAQTRTCKKRVKTYCFPMFSVGRVFFEKGSAVDCNSTQTTALGGQFEAQNGVQVALGGQFEGPSGLQVALGGQFEGEN